jgi:putative ABC transport system ATP-binding protein
LEDFDSGDVLYNNHTIVNLRHGEKLKNYRTSIGFVFQNFGLIDELSIYDNLNIATYGLKLKQNDKAVLFKSSLNKVKLDKNLDTKICALSGGEQQRVSLAKVLIKRYNLILIDEPTASLDVQNANNIIELIKSISNQDNVIVISTHDENVVKICDKKIEL